MNFILEHIDDVDAVFALEDEEITMVPAHAGPFRESGQQGRLVS